MTKNQELITAQPSTLFTRLFVSVATVLFILLLASCSDDDDQHTAPIVPSMRLARQGIMYQGEDNRNLRQRIVRLQQLPEAHLREIL